ncbi:MAG: exonuclease SbcCD subunit D C-terminal domain-containing protein, partial [Firmicutes bacterium]|nr:exonuclease SbcCD subunit D C-terminal domain-containing protein [Bacillota bacterium]
SATIVTMNEKGTVHIKTVPLIPKREMHHLRGIYEELTLKSFYEHTTYQQDYIYITLTDEEDIPDAVSRLQVIYRNLMKLDYDNERTRNNQQIEGVEDIETKTPMDLFEELYELQNNQPMSEEQRRFASSLMEQVMEVEQ